jgi:hypothetical protein
LPVYIPNLVYLIHPMLHCKYRVVHQSLRNFRTRQRNNQDRHSRKERINRWESLQVLLGNRRRGVLAGFTARGHSWQNVAWTGDKKAFCLGVCQNWVNCDGAMEVSDHVPHRTTGTWSVCPSADMLRPVVTIPATVPQGSAIPAGLTNYPVYSAQFSSRDFFYVASLASLFASPSCVS